MLKTISTGPACTHKNHSIRLRLLLQILHRVLQLPNPLPNPLLHILPRLPTNLRRVKIRRHNLTLALNLRLRLLLSLLLFLQALELVRCRVRRVQLVHRG